MDLLNLFYGKGLEAGLPWWAVSPSPFTLAQWVVLSLIGVHYIRHGSFFNRLWKSILVLGMVVLSSDAIWVFLSLIRWGSLHPPAIPQLIYALLRDVGGTLFCVYEYGNRWQMFDPLPDRDADAFMLLNMVFIVVWFLGASNPAYTDWTYAIINGYSWGTVWSTFFTSHIVGRMFTGLIYGSVLDAF